MRQSAFVCIGIVLAMLWMVFPSPIAAQTATVTCSSDDGARQHCPADTSKGVALQRSTKPIRIEHLKPCIDWWGGRERKGRLGNEVAWRVTADEVKARGYNLDFKNPHASVDDHTGPQECWPSLMKGRSQPPPYRPNSRPFWERRSCDELGTSSQAI
jgi:hypothetical protein